MSGMLALYSPIFYLCKRGSSENRSLQLKLEGGLLLPLVESFYTIQGEGYHVGKAAYFIRLGGCDVGCSWCDAKETWNLRKFPPVEVEKIVADALACPARSIVITGGEPLRYPLDILCDRLTEENLEIFLETSGSEPLTGRLDLSFSQKEQPSAQGKLPVRQRTESHHRRT